MSTVAEFVVVYDEVEGRFAIEHFSGKRGSWANLLTMAAMWHGGKKYVAVSRVWKGDLEPNKIYQLELRTIKNSTKQLP